MSITFGCSYSIKDRSCFKTQGSKIHNQCSLSNNECTVKDNSQYKLRRSRRHIPMHIRATSLNQFKKSILPFLPKNIKNILSHLIRNINFKNINNIELQEDKGEALANFIRIFIEMDYLIDDIKDYIKNNNLDDADLVKVITRLNIDGLNIDDLQLIKGEIINLTNRIRYSVESGDKGEN